MRNNYVDYFNKYIDQYFDYIIGVINTYIILIGVINTCVLVHKNGFDIFA